MFVCSVIVGSDWSLPILPCSAFIVAGVGCCTCDNIYLSKYWVVVNLIINAEYYEVVEGFKVKTLDVSCSKVTKLWIWFRSVIIDLK